MAGFNNTKYSNTIDSLLTTMKNKIETNPNYKFTDKNPYTVTYFNINRDRSTLDEAAKITASSISPKGGIFWNKITNFILYGSEVFQLNMDVGDFGIQSQEIEGESIILPNTITPYTGDFFLINHVNEKCIFEVISVSPDTLENGANIYKIQYRSSDVIYDEKNIQLVLADSYTYHPDTVGTSYKSVILSEVSTLISNIEEYIYKLQELYKSLFYNNRVQAFTYTYLNNDYFYDPYMIEFIISNNIMTDLTDKSNYIYICHQTPLDKSFSLKYMKTLLYAAEKRDVRVDKYKISGYGKLINNSLLTFSNRYEDYYEICYDEYTSELIQEIPCFKQEILDGIICAEPFKISDDLILYNIIIKYFNNIDITQNDLDTLLSILDNQNDIDLYYAIPLIIYGMRSYTKSLMLKNK